MSIKESALNAITSITQSDFIRAVTAAGASRRVTVANLAKAIIESYTGSSLAGGKQSVKAALDALNSKTSAVSIQQNTDLDNLESSGFYFSGTSAITATLTNCPITGSGFFLLIPPGNYVIQIIFTHHEICLRSKGSSGWRPWQRVTGNE